MPVIKYYYCDACGESTTPHGIGDKDNDGVARTCRLSARIWTEETGTTGHRLDLCGDCTKRVEEFLSNLIVLKTDK